MVDHRPEQHEGGVPAGQHAHGRQSPKSWTKRELRWDDLVVICFALLGFVGSVVLYRMQSSTTIISFFLATGVASVVYRFLGGIDQTQLVWGTFKVGGTLAALLGIAMYVNQEMKVQQNATDDTYGKYEWQYADAGWKGHIVVEKNGNSSIDMQVYIACKGSVRPLKLLEQAGPGKAELNRAASALHISFPVRFFHYDDQCNLSKDSETTELAGDLARVPGFSGLIEYRSKYSAPLGGMVLTKRTTP